MKRFWTTVGSAGVIALCALNAGQAAERARAVVSGSHSYLNTERTAYFKVEGGHSEMGSLEPPVPAGGQSIERGVGAYAYECSSVMYRCLKTSTHVFAIPRTALSPMMTYAFEGTQFLVQECLRTEGPACQVALIQGDCQFVRNAETCEPYVGGRRMSPRPGPVTYFIYNQVYGVTSLGLENDVLSNADAKFVSRRFVLLGQRGILKE